QSFETYLDDYSKGSHIDEASELLAAALVQTKNYERAYKIMEGMKTQSPLIKEAYQKVTYFRAVELYNDHKSDEALSLIEKSLKNPVNAELQAYAIYLKAEILYSKERYDEASQLFQRFAQYSTPAIEKKGEASKFRAAYNTGYCAFKKKNYSDAALYFGDAIEEGQTTADTKGKTSLLPDLFLRYADCAFITKNYSKAVDAYAKIVTMNWSNAEYAQFQKGIILGLQNKEEEKIEALNTLIAKFPGSNYADQANYELGETYLQIGNNAQARVAYQTIITKNANNAYLPKAYVKIGVIDYNTGKKEQAIDDYKLVVKKFPESVEARESLEALKDIYVELGRADEYFAFAKGNSNIVISSSEEDSLTYQAADNAYNSSDCARSITLYGNYTTKFPNGIFAADAHWKKADCHIKAKDFANAFKDYEALIQNKYSKYYEKALLKASGIAYYELHDYEKANTFYSQLYMVSTSAQNTYTALIGRLRSSVQLNNNDAIIEAADQFVNSGAAKDADLQEAIYVKAKAYYSKGDKEFALGAFNRVTEMPVSEKAVEAKYMVAKILFEQQKYKNSMDTCFKLKNKYSSYEYWVAKTFVLIADDYYALGNSFQAKATLESIIENYDGDKAVLEEAKAKLETIRADEIKKSRLLELVPGDTLIMEQDSILKN
nr:tetratricopeptide repeat protein [Chitinophagales bacterium]